MARHKTNQKITRKFGNLPEQLRKITAVIAVLPIGIDVLPEQCDFLAAALHKRAYLGKNILRRPAALCAAHIRNDTIRAKIVAAIHDADHARNGLSLSTGRPSAITGSPTFGKNSRFFSVMTRKRISGSSQSFSVPKTKSITDSFSEYTRSFPAWKHTSANTDEKRRLRSFQMLISACDGKRLFFRVIANGAGIDHNQIRRLHRIRLSVSHFTEHTEDPLAVRLVCWQP